MRVKVESLTEGYRLIADVKGKTNLPLVPRNTVITREIIDVLRAFLIEEVEVEKIAYTKVITEQKRTNINEPNMEKETEIVTMQKEEFYYNYSKVVEEFRKEFKKWQAGIDIDIYTIRKNIIPLFEEFLALPYHLLLIHKYGENGKYFFHQAVAIALISGLIAKKLDLPRSDTNQVILAAILSNCGMAKLDVQLMRKTVHTEAEQKELRKHPGISYKMVQDIPSLNTAAKLAILQHEEREDGSGFPFGEKSERIHLYAKIIACSDEYYKMVWDPETMQKNIPLNVIEKMDHEIFGKININVLEALKACIAQYAVDMNVRLSNKDTGKIVFVDLNHPSRPVIKLENGGEIISLNEEQKLQIIDIY
mgnify:CR=1 FL=1